LILNVARGGIVDEAAVAQALRKGQLGGAGIDVFEHEPPTDSPLLDAPNTVLTPHLGASTEEAQVLVAEEVAGQVLDVLAGRPVTVAGTVANGEPRLVRLDDYWLDMAPGDVMLITRHQDKPGTMGRIGLILGDADVNISAMHLARTRPREDAFMILALDDDV